MTYTMIVSTQTVRNGKEVSTTETITRLSEDRVAARRSYARITAPAGATRTIRVLAEN